MAVSEPSTRGAADDPGLVRPGVEDVLPEDTAIDDAVQAALFDVPLPVRMIGRYKILGRLGRGAMGIVYEAFDEELDRRVAVKVIREGIHATTRARALREARALARLKHPNVVAIYDADTQGMSAWIAMELVNGQTLRTWQGAPRSWREALSVLTDVVRGVAAAHAEGLVHRDLKPENVMIGQDGSARVLDFGIAHGRRSDAGDNIDGRVGAEGGPRQPAQQLTSPGVVQGTPGYMAPEQCRGEEVDAAADQFGWSVMAWELLYGQMPFADREALLSGTRTPPPSDRRVPGWLHRIVERGLAADPRKRHLSMSHLLTALGADPTPRRWKLGILAMGLALAVAARAGWQTYHRQQAMLACGRAAAEVDAVWNDAARAQMRDGFIGTGASFAATTVEKATARLDGYAAAWRAARDDLCMNGTVTFEATPEVVKRGEACLRGSLGDLDVLLEVFATPGDGKPAQGVVRGAVTAIARLPWPATCHDESQLRGHPHLPEDEALHGRLSQVQRTLALARTLTDVGRYDDSLELLDEVQVEADTLRWSPLQAAIDLQRGTILTDQAKYAAAEVLLESAFFKAGYGGDRAIQADAAIVLTSNVGSLQARRTDGLRWGKMADLLLEQAAVPDGDMRLKSLLTILGYIHNDMGEHAESVRLHTRALELAERTLGTRHPSVAKSLSDLSDTLRLLGDFEAAIGLSTRAIAIHEETLGPDHPSVANALGNLGAVHFGLNQYDQAAALLVRAQASHERIFGPDHPVVATSLNNLGAIQLETGAPERALELLTRALEIRERKLGLTHPDVATTLQSLAQAHRELGSPDLAIELLTRALAIREEAGEREHPKTVKALRVLAAIHQDRGLWRQADELQTRAVALQEKLLGPEHPDLIAALAELGTTRIGQGLAADARPLLERALELSRKHPTDPARHAMVQFTLARALWSEREHRDRARILVHEARVGFEGAGVKHEKELAEVRSWMVTHGV